MYTKKSQLGDMSAAICPKCGCKRLLISSGSLVCTDCGHVLSVIKVLKKANGLKIIKKCKQCGNDFESIKYKIRSFCSHKCSNTYANNKRSAAVQKKIVCLTCKKVFYKRPSDLRIYKSDLAKKKFRYCSQPCWLAKTQTISSLKLKAWSRFALYIKNRDNWTCYTCGKYEIGPTMHAGHYISRRHNATLFDEENVHAQCASCNMFNNGQPHLYTERIIAEKGQEFLLSLIKKSKEPKSFTKSELIDLCAKYKA